MEDSGGKNLRHREVSMLVWMYCVRAEDPPENYVPGNKCIHQGHQKCTGKRVRNITKKFTGSPFLVPV